MIVRSFPETEEKSTFNFNFNLDTHVCWILKRQQKDTDHLLELSTMTPLSIEKLSVGKPAIFQARIFIGSPIQSLSWNELEQVISCDCERIIQ